MRFMRVGKSNKKEFGRLKDSCRHNKIRSERHFVNKLLKDGRFEDVEELDEKITIEEDNKNES